MSAPRIVVGTPKRGIHERAFLYCPSGHEVVSAPTSHQVGRRLAAGDFSGEWCGHGGCGWEATPAAPTGEALLETADSVGGEGQ